MVTHLKGRERKKDRDLSCDVSFPKWPQMPKLDQLNAGDSFRGPMGAGAQVLCLPLLLSQYINIELDQK